MPIDKAKLIGFFKTLSKIDEDILQLENEIKLIFIEAKKTRLELERRFDQLLIDGNEDLSRYSRAQSRLNIRKEMIKEREKIEIERLENEYRLKINQTRRGGLLLIDEFTKKENIIKQKYEKIYKQIDDWKDDFASKAKKIKDNDQFQKDNVKMQLDRLFIDAETKAQDKSYEIAKLKVQKKKTYTEDSFNFWFNYSYSTFFLLCL